MKWDVRNIAGITFVIFVVLLAIAIRTNSQTAFLFSEAVLSVVITLVIVERIITEDRELQWERVKILTYMAILMHISQLALSASHFLDHSWGSNHTIKYVGVINHNFYEPNAEAAIAIVNLANVIDNDYKHRSYYPSYWKDRDGYEKFMHAEAVSIESYYNKVEPLLNDIRTILIPRVLQLSNNQKVNESLLTFEDDMRKFESAVRDQKSLARSNPIARWQIPFLLKGAGVLYDILQYELKN